MKIGILGGSFNPPHIGHLILAQDVLEALGLDKVFFIPTNISPHKNNNEVEAEKRLEMLNIAIEDNDKFQALDLEIKRGDISYTIDTIRELKSNYPEDDFYLIIGSDLANDFSNWKEPEAIKNAVNIVVAKRQDHPLDSKNNFTIVDIKQVEISSSLIRNLISKGKLVKYLLRDRVSEYINKHKLYL